MKSRVLGLMVVLAVTLSAVPAVAGHGFFPRRVVHRHVWGVPHVAPIVPRRYYYPPVVAPVVVPPRVLPGYYVPRASYLVPGGYYYDPGLDVGVYGRGFGLHIDF